jgi:hypothetical protein
VLNDEGLISAIFYLAGGRVRGSTRLQKVVFLVERVLGLGGLRFEPWRYGPWSRELEKLLKELEGRGLLKVCAESPDLASEFFVEPPAKVYEASQDLIGRARGDPLKAMYMRRLVRAALSVPLSFLIAYIYSSYPEMTMRSTIHDRVEEWRRTYGLGIGG